MPRIISRAMFWCLNKGTSVPKWPGYKVASAAVDRIGLSLSTCSNPYLFPSWSNLGRMCSVATSSISKMPNGFRQPIVERHRDASPVNDALINPQSIVIVGGSNVLNKPGGAVINNLLKSKYQGQLYVINPRERQVQGIPCLTDEHSVSHIDLAIITVAAKFVKDIVADLIQKYNIRAFMVFSAGFSEMGEEGKRLEEELVDLITKNNAALLGPNCLGILTPYYNGIFAGTIPELSPTGCDFVSSSGFTAGSVIDQGIAAGLTFSSYVSIGNAAQVGAEEFLQYWDETFDREKGSRIKLIYIENIRRPDLFLRHASSLVKKGCKIAAVKAGVSDAGKRAALSHTGAMANPDMAVDALFRKAGVIRCEGREDLIRTAVVFTQGEMSGNNMAIVTEGGGPGVMLADTLSRFNINVPPLSGRAIEELKKMLNPGAPVGNPIDLMATFSPKQVVTLLDYLDKNCPEIDAISLITGDSKLQDLRSMYKLFYEQTRIIRKPVYMILAPVGTATESLEYYKSLGGSFFSDEVVFGRTLGKVVQSRRQFKEEERETAVDLDVEQIRSVIQGANSGYLLPADVSELLKAAGIPKVQNTVINNHDALIRCAEALGYPLAMKVVGPIHKSDCGGVVLNVSNAKQATNVFDQLMQIKGAQAVMVQPMLRGMELYTGVKYEPGYGHLILCGLGGVFVEILKDVAVELSPVGHGVATEMIKSLKAYPIIAGARGQEGASVEGFADIIARLSALIQVAPEIMELDFNPIIATKDSVSVVDVRISIDHRFDPNDAAQPEHNHVVLHGL